MAEREELILEVEVDKGRASSDLRDMERDIKDAEDAAEDLGLEFETTEQKIRAVTTVIEAMAETVDVNLRAGKEAADALGRALGPELSAKVDIDQIVADLERMGLTTDEIKANADQLAASFKKIDGIKTKGLADGLDYTNQRMTGLRNNADQSRSVLANMAGNASQDLGQLGGVAGSAGVALGQLAEYAVDGNIKLSNLAKVAAPLLGVTVAILGITEAMGAIKAEDAFNQELVDNFSAALREGQDAMTALREQIEQTGTLEFETGIFGGGGLLGLGSTTRDLIPLFAELGLTYDDFVRLVNDPTGADQLRKMKDEFLDLALAADDDATGDAFQRQAEAARDAADGVEDYQNSSEAALDSQAELDAFLGRSADALTRLNDRLTALQDPMQTMPELWNALIRDAKDGTFEWENAADAVLQLADATGQSEEAIVSRINQEADKALQAEARAAEEAAAAEREHAAALRETSAALVETVGGFNALEQRSDAITAAFDRLNGQSELTATQEVVDFADGLSTLGDALDDLADSDVNLDGLDLVPDSWDEVLNMPEELQPVLNALSGFRDTMQTEFAQAFARGGEPAALEWAENTRRAIVDELARAGIEAPEQVNQILSALGLLPEQVEITIEASNGEQARSIIEDIGSAIDTLPTDVQLRIAAVAQDDPVAALQLAISALQESGVEVPAELVLVASELGVQVDAAVAAAGTPRVAVSADTAPMSEQILTASEDTPTATIDTIADTAQAAEDLLTETSRGRVAIIRAAALTQSAGVELDDLASAQRTARIDVATGSVNVLTAAQIANRIGVVRVPIVGVWQTRTEGSRPR